MLALGLGVTLVYGIFEGNAGTAFRHRSVLMPIAFLFAAAGILDLKNRFSRRRSDAGGNRPGPQQGS